MGWFSDAVSSVSNVVAPVVKAATAPVTAAVDIVKGENVLESVSKAVVAPYTAAQGVAANLGLDKAVSNVPLVGGILQKNISSGAAINNGDVSFSNLRDFGVSGGLLAGGYLGGSALASAGALTPTNIGLGLLGTKVLSGDKTALYGALSAATGLPADEFYPKTDKNFPVQDLNNFLQSDDSVPSVSSLSKKPLNWQGYAVIGGVVLAAYLIAKRKK